MKLITVKQAAEKWDVTVRHVQNLCKEGRIKGATRWERTWMIPEYAVLPKKSNASKTTLPMPKRSPFLDMTSIYRKAGTAKQSSALLENNPEARMLFDAQIAYRRGEIEKVYEHARYFLNAHSGFYAILGGGMLLSLCSIWKGDIRLWNEAKKES